TITSIYTLSLHDALPILDDDALARLDERRRRSCDRALLRHADVLTHREGHTDEMGLMARAHRLGAAANPLDLAALRKRVDVAADGGFRSPEEVQEIGNADDGALLHELQDQIVSFSF